ncbi:CYFA0S02e07030g1_1 [Cyberlindnera fabianii]|uniref:CYFA0S02e07030g1_1 n=1 Tax=Cyberlindnera fabianii TaxID=36022 RepID=A0A061AMR7_CYBFA|nr:CYFA0S02e07030g1_1 [Cyberlindnera fabianii]
MGRRKISIQPITDERNRKVTFVKRKAGLFKKAHELAVLCQVDLAVIILGHNNQKFYEYTSVNADDLLVSYKDGRFTHDVKTPEDYGDYALESRVNGNGLKTHHRNTSSVSFSIEEKDDDEDDDDDDDDDEEDESKPVVKRRKTTKNHPRVRSEPEVEVPPSIQAPASNAPHPAPVADPSSYPQHMRHPQAAVIVPSSQHWAHHPGHPEADTVPPHYQGFQIPTMQQPYQFPVQGNFNNSPLQHRQDPMQPPQAQHLPAINTPMVQNTQHIHSSPFMNSRARSLNNSISTRPILRVEIPSDPTKPTPGSKPEDSAVTMTAPDTSKGNNKDISNTSKADGEKTPSSARSGDDIKPSGLGILSNHSTPVSATLPSGLFNLPPPNPTAHFHSGTTAGGFKTTATGEQTPLTGLPSRYVPDLFPSPSNFYSNDWNIPFGSGNTPYPSSAGPYMLQIPGGSNAAANAKVRKHTMLNNDPVDSPLQNFQKDAKAEAKDGDQLEGKKIRFSKMKPEKGDDK